MERLRLTIYISGALIVVFLAIHLSLFTFWITEGGYYTGMDWETVSSRMASLGWDIFYILFLTTVMIHSYTGIKNILFEYITGDRGRRIVSYIMTVIWGVAFIYGLLPIMATP